MFSEGSVRGVIHKWKGNIKEVKEFTRKLLYSDHVSANLVDN